MGAATTTTVATTQPETTEENVLPGTGTTTPTPVETTTTVEIIETTTEKIPATTTPVEPVVETTTTSEPGKLCQEPMDVDDVIDGIRTTQLPRLIASSNIPTGNIGRITSDQPWTPAATDDDSTDEPWIQIEFDQEDEPVYIFGLVIKGAGEDTNHFVTKVRIESKLPGDEEFSPVTDDVTFDANTDDATPSNIYFTDEHQPILATVVRIYPVEWEGDEPAVRVGLLGCFKVVQTTPVKTTTQVVTTTTPVAVVDTTTPMAVVDTTTPMAPVETTTPMAPVETTPVAPVETTPAPVETTTPMAP